MKNKTKHGFGLQLHITDDCDQRCVYCYIFNDPTFKRNNLSIKDISLIVKKFKKFCKSIDCYPSIAITGGDPLIRKDIWDILEILKKNNIEFDILGNPFHITDVVAKKLKDYGCYKYQLSIDGMKKTHDSLRKSGSFDKTISAIKILQNAHIKAHVMMTVSKMNYEEVIDVIRYVSAIPVDGFAFARYCPTSLEEAKYNIEPQKYRSFLSSVWSVYEELANGKTKFFLKDHLWTPFLYENGLFETREEDMIFEGCGCGIRHLTVLADGTIYACRRFKSAIGNALDDDFSDVFNGHQMNQYRDFEKMECYPCELFNYCRGCPAVAYGTYGSFYKKDPQCWR